MGSAGDGSAICCSGTKSPELERYHPKDGWEMAALAIGLGGAVGELWVQDGLLAMALCRCGLPPLSEK